MLESLPLSKWTELLAEWELNPGGDEEAALRAARICQAFAGGALADYMRKPYEPHPDTQHDREVALTLKILGRQ